MNLFNKIPNWLVSIISVVIIGILLKFFYEFKIVALIIWLTNLMIVFLIYKSGIAKSIHNYFAKKLRIISVILSIVISISFFMGFDEIRDMIGKQIIEGYSATYMPDIDEYGRDTYDVLIHTDNWSTRFLLWLGEWGFLVFVVLIPYLIWKWNSKIIDVSINKKYKADK